jgi:dimethylargininase
MHGGERTFVGRERIDHDKALAQHAAYCAALEARGFTVRTLEPEVNLPDCAFVEDCAVALREAALICRPGVSSRRSEVDAVAAEIRQFKPTVFAMPPATIEGGDVLIVGDRMLVGRSCRTNDAGIVALRKLAEPMRYRVVECHVHGCLHLKTACTFLPDGSLLANSNWVSLPADHKIVSVPDDEPWAGNILLAGETIVAASSQPRTNKLLRSHGFIVIEVDISEFQKAEGGVTCLSILIDRAADDGEASSIAPA